MVPSLCGRHRWPAQAHTADGAYYEEHGVSNSCCVKCFCSPGMFVEIANLGYDPHEECRFDWSLQRPSCGCQWVCALRHAGCMHGNLPHDLASAHRQPTSDGRRRRNRCSHRPECRSGHVQWTPALLFRFGHGSGTDEWKRSGRIYPRSAIVTLGLHRFRWTLCLAYCALISARLTRPGNN